MTSRYTNPPCPISRDVVEQLPWLVRDLGFRKLEEHFDPTANFGNSYVTFNAGCINVQFARDKGEVLSRVASCHCPARWYILGQVCEFISGHREDASTLGELGALIRDNLENIQIALGPNFEKNKPLLEEFETRRFKEHWDKL